MKPFKKIKFCFEKNITFCKIPHGITYTIYYRKKWMSYSELDWHWNVLSYGNHVFLWMCLNFNDESWNHSDKERYWFL